jgi:hypothetical protein
VPLVFELAHEDAGFLALHAAQVELAAVAIFLARNVAALERTNEVGVAIGVEGAAAGQQ